MEQTAYAVALRVHDTLGGYPAGTRKIRTICSIRKIRGRLAIAIPTIARNGTLHEFYELNKLYEFYESDGRLKRHAPACYGTVLHRFFY